MNKKELWCKVWVAVAGSSNCTKLSAPTKYADEAVKEYEEKFEKASSEETEEKKKSPEEIGFFLGSDGYWEEIRLSNGVVYRLISTGVAYTQALDYMAENKSIAIKSRLTENVYTKSTIQLDYKLRCFCPDGNVVFCNDATVAERGALWGIYEKGKKDD